MFEFKEELTTDNILSRIDDEKIFRYYCKPFKQIGEHFNSELRKDINASCMISYYNDKLWYKDFGLVNQKAVDCFGYVMLKYSHTFMQTLGVINLDFNLGLKNYTDYQPSLNYVGLPDNKFTNLKKISTGLNSNDGFKIIKPTFRNWLEIDVKYWKNSYYLDIPRLEFFEIHPISQVEINGKLIKVDLQTYAFLVDKDKEIDFYKIYSPFNSKYKWIANCKNYHYLGYNQLPWLGKKLIITKSLKDVAVLSLFNLPAIAPQSEAQIISHDMYEGLKKRFTQFYVLYDNDRAGIAGAMQTVDVYPEITPIFIPKESGVKDISDFINKYRYRPTHKLINELCQINL